MGGGGGGGGGKGVGFGAGGVGGGGGGGGCGGGGALGATFLQRQLNPFVPHCPVASGKNCVAPPCFSSKLLIVQPFVRPLPV